MSILKYIKNFKLNFIRNLKLNCQKFSMNTREPNNLPSTNDTLFSPPIRIIPGGAIFQHKSKLAFSKHSYRCLDRTCCNSIIHISKESLSNYMDSPLSMISIQKTIHEHTILCKYFINPIPNDDNNTTPNNTNATNNTNSTNNNNSTNNTNTNNTTNSDNNNSNSTYNINATNTNINNDTNINNNNNNNNNINNNRRSTQTNPDCNFNNIKRLININIFKPLSFHISFLRENSVNLTSNQVKYQLEKLRNPQFLNDKRYLKNPFFSNAELQTT